MRARILGVVVLAAAAGAVARADDRPLDRTELDRRVVKVVYDTALIGTELGFDPDEGYVDTPVVWRPDLGAGDTFTGPAIVEEFGSCLGQIIQAAQERKREAGQAIA